MKCIMPLCPNESWNVCDDCKREIAEYYAAEAEAERREIEELLG